MNMKIVVLFCVYVFAKAETIEFNDELTADDEKFPDLLPPLTFTLSRKINEKSDRIVGGQEAYPHQFPFQAGLYLHSYNGNGAFCGGSLIAENFILTAAHCVDGMARVEVVLGAHRIREKEALQTRMISTKIIIHSGWNGQWMKNDIALIELPKKVQLNGNIQLIRLPSRSDTRNFLGYNATVSGWGRTSDATSGTSYVLKYTSAKIINNVECAYTYPFIIRPIHICMDGREGKSSCNGDSGGPLTIQENGKSLQIGIVSFGRSDGCAKGHPPVFTRITSYLDWIHANMKH